jgi:hypothetical protein
VYGRLDLIGNDELDGGGFERVLWIEPNHEVKNLILEKVSKKCPISEAGGKGRGTVDRAAKSRDSGEKTAPCTNFPQEPLSKKTMS